MKIAGFQKLTTLDYPDTIAAIIFTHGCNLLCPFCHNPSLVVGSNTAFVCEDEVFEYLNKRKHILQGLCISGGEPLLQPDLADFIKKVKQLGLKVKLDTNGCFPNLLKDLLDEKLIDYVAIDIKNCLSHYPKTVGLASIDTSKILETIALIKSAKIDFEFRTTLVKELHSIENLESIGKDFGCDGKLYLQNFIRSDEIINDITAAESTLTSFSLMELKAAKQILEKYFKEVIIRGE